MCFSFVRPIKCDQQRGDEGNSILIPHLYFLTVSLANHRQLLWLDNGFHIGRGKTGIRGLATISGLTTPSVSACSSLRLLDRVTHTQPCAFDRLSLTLTKQELQRGCRENLRCKWEVSVTKKGFKKRVICSLETREEPVDKRPHGYSVRGLQVIF